MLAKGTVNDADTPEDIEFEVGRDAMVTACARIHNQGVLAMLDGLQPEDCPAPVLSMGALLWLSGLTGSAIATAGTA